MPFSISTPYWTMTCHRSDISSKNFNKQKIEQKLNFVLFSNKINTFSNKNLKIKYVTVALALQGSNQVEGIEHPH